jgi:hypothetical protein
VHVVRAVLKNLLRGAALAMAATFLGCFVVYTLPDWVAAQLNRTMPYWFYEREVRLPHLSGRMPDCSVLRSP